MILKVYNANNMKNNMINDYSLMKWKPIINIMKILIIMTMKPMKANSVKMIMKKAIWKKYANENMKRRQWRKWIMELWMKNEMKISS